MAEKGFWPLYEGKHIEQFLVDIRPIERWVSLEAAERKYGKLPDAKPKVVFRDIARNTDERTCIAAVLPERSCANNKLPILDVAPAVATRASTVLNSFAFDFALRFRISSTLNFTHVTRVAVPPLSATGSLQEVDTFTVAGQDLDSTLARRELWETQWLANRGVAEAYGLGPDDFEHILSTFPVFARKRSAFYAYLQERVQEWKREVEPGTAAIVPLAAEAPAGYRPGTTAPLPRQSPSPRRR
jgi:hypothetical protein